MYICIYTYITAITIKSRGMNFEENQERYMKEFRARKVKRETL